MDDLMVEVGCNASKNCFNLSNNFPPLKGPDFTLKIDPLRLHCKVLCSYKITFICIYLYQSILILKMQNSLTDKLHKRPYSFTTVTTQQEVSLSEGLSEFACSPCVCMCFLQVIGFPSTVPMHARWARLRTLKLPLGVRVNDVCLCVVCDGLPTCPGYIHCLRLTCTRIASSRGSRSA